MPLRCITFDLDDTLWDCEPVIARAEQRFYDWTADNYPRITERYAHDAMVVHRRRFFTRFPDRGHDFTWLRKRWLAHLAEEAEYEAEHVVESGFRVFWEARNEVTLYEHVDEVLQGLRQRFRVGVITNGNADVHRVGIGHHFDFVITAASAGAQKPAPRIFHAALQAAEVHASEAVHVGDDPTRDVLGAGHVGMRTIWYNPSLAAWPGGRTPDAVVRNLREVAAEIDRLQ